VLVVFGAVTAASTEGFAQQRSRVRIEGQVQTGGGPLANSTVTLWAASAGEPKQLVQTKSGSDGRFELRAADTPGKDVVLYVVAKGGIATVNKGSGDNPATALLTVLGNQPRPRLLSTNSPQWRRRLLPLVSSRAKQSREIHSDYGSLPGTLRTWLIPRPADGARCFLIRSTAQ